MSSESFEKILVEYYISNSRACNSNVLIDALMLDKLMLDHALDYTTSDDHACTEHEGGEY